MSKRSRKKHSSVRDLFDAGDELAPSPFDNVAPDDNSSDADEVDLPRVVIGTVADFGAGVPAVVARFPDRPVWFILDSHDRDVGVFERYPEEPLPEAVTTSILGFLRTFSSDHHEDLQSLLGPTDTLRFGFHTSASIEDVVESFEDDGFDVLLGLREGKVDLPED